MARSGTSVYQRYVERFPEPLDVAIETRFELATLHASLGDVETQHAELRRIVTLHEQAGAARTDRTRYLAAKASLVLTEGLFDRFAEVRLTQPFEKSLQEKQRRMDRALAGFGALVDYEVGEVTAAATFYMAEIYRDFGAALLASERPGDLGPAELLEYDDVLEEEAFPFEEKAIVVHEKNLELMGAGVYNRWIEKSLATLGQLMPGRYAKYEESSGVLDSLDRYTYRSPAEIQAIARAEAAAQEAAQAESEPAPDAETDAAEAEVEPEVPADVPAAPAPGGAES